jgi:hypothetical protein
VDLVLVDQDWRHPQERINPPAINSSVSFACEWSLLLQRERHVERESFDRVGMSVVSVTESNRVESKAPSHSKATYVVGVDGSHFCQKFQQMEPRTAPKAPAG